MPTETFCSFWNKLTSDENLVCSLLSCRIIFGKLPLFSKESVYFSEKCEKSGVSAKKKISKFLGNLSSEQIFYRNVPLGAPVMIQLDC